MNKLDNKICNIATMITCVLLALIFMGATLASERNIAVPAVNQDIVYARVTTTAEPTIIPTASSAPVATEDSQINIGTFKLTFYCPCSKCCGKSDGITATGTRATEGRTVAVDPSVLPFGSRVVINGHEYIVEDSGVSGNTIDIYVDNHQRALEYGVQYATVYLRKE